MTVRALVFDVFGTLVDWRSGVASAFRAAGIGDDGEALADAWRVRYPGILAEVNEGRREWADFDALHLVTLDAVLEEAGFSPPDAGPPPPGGAAARTARTPPARGGWAPRPASPPGRTPAPGWKRSASAT